jgi:hypothetical protein
MSSWHSYPKIYALGHSAVKDVFLDDIVAEEKVDGSQFSFGVFNGEVKMRSKGAELYFNQPEKMFEKALQSVFELKELLRPEWTYRGEFLSRPKHNVIKYDRVPKKNIVLFDVNTEEEEYLSYEDLLLEAKRIGLETVPLIYFGKISSSAEVAALIDRPSFLGGSKVEGVVFKNYRRFGPDKKALMAKFVSEEFKESHKKNYKSGNGEDVLQTIICSLRTEARWAKAVQHLRDDGILENTPRDIGQLLKEVSRDLEAEEEEYIKETLYNAHKDRIRRAVSVGLAEWYKKKLVESQFESSSE